MANESMVTLFNRFIKECKDKGQTIDSCVIEFTDSDFPNTQQTLTKRVYSDELIFKTKDKK